MTESEVSIKAAIAVLEERALNLANWAIGFTSVLPNAKMELSSPLTEEIAELEELTVSWRRSWSSSRRACPSRLRGSYLQARLQPNLPASIRRRRLTTPSLSRPHQLGLPSLLAT